MAQSRGKLRPEPCRRCGAEPAEKHHPDYEKPLEVEWLCRSCHRRMHTLTKPEAVGMILGDEAF